MYSIWPIALAAFLGLSAGYGIAILGGVGVARKLRMRMTEIEGDYESLSERLTREQKRRAGVAASEARATDRTDKELQKEAQEHLAKENAGQIPLIKGGFPSVFNRG